MLYTTLKSPFCFKFCPDPGEMNVNIAESHCVSRTGLLQGNTVVVTVFVYDFVIVSVTLSVTVTVSVSFLVTVSFMVTVLISSRVFVSVLVIVSISVRVSG